MRAIKLTGTTWIAADIHLNASMPKTAAKFYSFLDSAQQHAQNLILAGDIYDAWIGDDYAHKNQEPWLQNSIQALQQTASKINLYLIQGNRDFLLGTDFANMVNAEILPSPCIISNDGLDFLLAHGDEYCIDDIAYQRFRKIVRNGIIQRLFLYLPLAIRLKIAKHARIKSQQAQKNKTTAIMDVNQQAVIKAISAAGTQHLVHGHTHRPDTHKLSINSTTAYRYVLSDWDLDHGKRYGWVSVDKNGINTQQNTDI